MSVLLPATTITTAVTGLVGPTVAPRRVPTALLIEAAFVYGSGGTTAKAWVQTRSAGGTWRDIMAFAFTTASVKKWSGVHAAIALAAVIAASDAALADDTILNGFLGQEYRVKYTTTGTYAGNTTLTLLGTFKDA